MCLTLAVWLLLLFTGAFAHASDAPEAPPAPCRQCEALRYFPASAAIETGPDQPTPDGTEAGPDGEAYIPGMATAQVLVREGHFDEALAILRPMTQAHPKNTEILFLLGWAAVEAATQLIPGEEERDGLLDEAVASLHAILVDRPELVRVRLELGRAFFLQEEDGLAREQFERVLAGQLPEAVVANVQRFLVRIRARRRWNAYFGFSLAPDTNINSASDAEFIYIRLFPNQPALPFTRNAVSRASSGVGVVAWGGGEYQYPLSARLRLRAGLDLSRREYDGKQFDQTFVGGQIGPRWLVNPTTEISLLATASQSWFGTSAFSSSIGTRLEVWHLFSPLLRVGGRASWQERGYQQNKFLKGPLMVFSLSGDYVLLPTVRLNALFGYSQQETKARNWSNAGYWTQVGTNVALPWGFSLGLSGEFRWTNYEDGWPFHFRPDGSARKDQTRILQASLFNRGFTVYGFSPQVMFSNQVRESNARTFDFKRNLVELRWVRQF